MAPNIVYSLNFEPCRLKFMVWDKMEAVALSLPALKIEEQGWGCSSVVVEHLLGMHEALGFIACTSKAVNSV